MAVTFATEDTRMAALQITPLYCAHQDEKKSGRKLQRGIKMLMRFTLSALNHDLLDLIAEHFPIPLVQLLSISLLVVIPGVCEPA